MDIKPSVDSAKLLGLDGKELKKYVQKQQAITLRQQALGKRKGSQV